MNVGKSLGVLLIVAGLALGGLVAWTVADPLAGHRQHALQQELQRTWAAQKPIPAVSGACTDPPQRLRPSQPFALMTIPAFGPQWKFAVVEGTTLTELALGPGHITGTSMPGGLARQGQLHRCRGTQITDGIPSYSDPCHMLAGNSRLHTSKDRSLGTRGVCACQVVRPLPPR
jgi:hypothetical protein